MTTDPFTNAARLEGIRKARGYVKTAPETAQAEDGYRGGFRAGAEWARTHLAAQRAEEARAWAVQQYPSGTPLDQDRRMVAAETEAYLSGRSERDMSELAQAAKHAGPVDPPAQEPTDAEVEAAARGLHAALEAVHGTAWDDLGKAHRNRWYDLARAALTAASAARRGESDDSNHPG